MSLGTAPAVRWHELLEGEMLSGTVRRLPEPGVPAGTRLFLEVDGELISIPAVARRGHTVLERLLLDERVAVGDCITIIFLGWRRTLDEQREYRAYELEVHECD